MFEKILFPVKREPLIHNGQETGKDIISREDNGDFISVVSKDYLLIENKLIVNNLLKEFSELINFNDKEVISKRIFSNNNYFSFSFDLNYPKQEVEVGDYIGAVLRIDNSYDGTSSLRLSMNAKRLVCSNGMVVNKPLFYNKKKHIGDIDANDVVQNMLAELKNNGEDAFMGLNSLFQDMVKTKLTPEIKSEFLKRVGGYQQYVVDSITQKIISESPKNFWELYNCVTYVMTHNMDRSKQTTLTTEENINKELVSLIN